MPLGCGKTLLKEWWQCLGLRCGNEDESGGPTPISGQSASNLRIPLLQSATGVRAASRDIRRVGLVVGAFRVLMCAACGS